jgi:hypothetical protein
MPELQASYSELEFFFSVPVVLGTACANYCFYTVKVLGCWSQKS